MSTTIETMRRPRIKPEHRPYRTVDGNLRIGSVIHGIGAEILDPDGWVGELAAAMDGTRSVDQICAEVAGARPALSVADLRTAMADLLAAGFVEDAGAPVDLSARERERYSRSVPLLRWMDLGPRATPWEAQLRLARARVLQIGVGGTGGFAAQALVGSGVGRLHLVDPDDVEISNLNRQPLFREPDIGAAKVDTAVASLRALNSDVEITGERREVTGRDELAALLCPPGGEPYDLLVLTADRPAEIRRWANRACLAAGVPWVDGGYHGPLVTVGVHAPGRGACWECLRAAEAERRDLRLAPGQDESVASPVMPWQPASAVTAGLSGTLLAHAAITLLTGIPVVAPGFRFGINLMLPGEPVESRSPRRPDCPACGERAADAEPEAAPGAASAAVPAAASGQGPDHAPHPAPDPQAGGRP